MDFKARRRAYFKRADDRLIISANFGSIGTSLLCFLLVTILLFSWVNFTLDPIFDTIQETDWPSNLVWFINLGAAVLLHESIQWLFLWLFGGRPRWSKRWVDEMEDYERTSLRTVLISPELRTWSPDTKYTPLQYLVVLLSPVFITFFLCPIIMIIWVVPAVFFPGLAMGIANSFLIPRDIWAAAILIFSVRFQKYYVVDRPEGTYLVKRFNELEPLN